METATENKELGAAPSGKRQQKYFRFQLLPNDDALIVRLPAAQRAALQSQGTYEERAAALGVAVGTVRSRLHRARAALEALRQEQDQTAALKDGPISH